MPDYRRPLLRANMGTGGLNLVLIPWQHAFSDGLQECGHWPFCELIQQLRDQCGDGQVEGAKVGMAQTYGRLGSSASAIAH